VDNYQFTEYTKYYLFYNKVWSNIANFKGENSRFLTVNISNEIQDKPTQQPLSFKKTTNNF
jgi:hypothetical protein